MLILLPLARHHRTTSASGVASSQQSAFGTTQTIGGYGSGLWRVSRRPLAEAMRRIDLATLRRGEPSITTSHRLEVKCHRRDGEVDVTNVYLEETRTHFGGRRLWFRCPRCDGRCRVLYGNWRIACRRCHRLRYCSQRETKEDRATRAMLKIVRRRNPDHPDPCNDLPEKPPRMHWATYDRLVERYEGHSEKWGFAILRRLGRRRAR